MIKAIQTRYDGYHFRSRAEARWAVFFSTVGLRYEYEKEGFHLPSGDYLPDFWLPELEFWFEVKGVNPTGLEVDLACQLSKATGCKAIIAVGPPSPNDQLIFLPDAVEFPDIWGGRYHFADDRRNEREFWLVSDSIGCFSIGPKFGPDYGKYPCVHSATKRGYDASRAARFEFNR